MTDALSPPPAADATHDEDELVFAASPATEPAAKAANPRRRRAIPVPSLPPSVAAPADADEPAEAPVPVPLAERAPAGSIWRDRALVAITLCALAASLVSVGGMLMVGRTLAAAQADRTTLEADLADFHRAPTTIAALDAASRRLTRASEQAAASAPAGRPATLDDLHHELDALKLSLDQHDPAGMGAIAGLSRDGFSDLGTRVDQLSGKIDALGAEINASRSASRAAGRAQPS